MSALVLCRGYHRAMTAKTRPRVSMCAHTCARDQTSVLMRAVIVCRYDVYAVAIVWLRIVIPALSSQRELHAFRTAVDREHGSRLTDWVESHCASSSSSVRQAMPDDMTASAQRMWQQWVAFFARGEHGRLAWRLLNKMMDSNPNTRIDADTALADPYLGGCGAAQRSAGVALAENTACAGSFSCYHTDGLVTDAAEECALAHEEAELQSITLPVATHGLLLQASLPTSATRVMVADVAAGGAAQASGMVRKGDELLAIGPLDVSERPLDEIHELLNSWRDTTAQFRLLRTLAGY